MSGIRGDVWKSADRRWGWRAAASLHQVSFLAMALTLVAAAWSPLRAGGVRDLADAWLAPPPHWGALLADPSARRGPPRWWSAVAQGRLFGLAELPQTGLAVGHRRGAWRASLAWERLGRGDLYREDLLRVGGLVGRRWRVGLQIDGQRLSLGGRLADRRVAVVLRVSAPLAAGTRLDVWWPLGGAPDWFGRRGSRRWARLSRVASGHVWTLVIDRRGDGVPLLQGELILGPVTGVALGGRVEPWSGTVGLVTAWRWGGIILRSSHLVHPELGVSHRWGLLLGGGA